MRLFALLLAVLLFAVPASAQYEYLLFDSDCTDTTPADDLCDITTSQSQPFKPIKTLDLVAADSLILTDTIVASTMGLEDGFLIVGDIDALEGGSFQVELHVATAEGGDYLINRVNASISAAGQLVICVGYSGYECAAGDFTIDGTSTEFHINTPVPKRFKLGIEVLAGVTDLDIDASIIPLH